MPDDWPEDLVGGKSRGRGTWAGCEGGVCASVQGCACERDKGSGVECEHRSSKDGFHVRLARRGAIVARPIAVELMRAAAGQDSGGWVFDVKMFTTLPGGGGGVCAMV